MKNVDSMKNIYSGSPRRQQMKLIMITIGSRGEVEPCVTLGAALQDQGFEVVIATHPNFADFIRSYGLAFALIDIDIDAFLASSASPMQQNSNSLGGFARSMRTMNTMMRKIGEDAWKAASSAEALFYTIGSAFFIPHLVEKLNVPAIGLYPYPVGTPTREFPLPMLPIGNLGGTFNK